MRSLNLSLLLAVVVIGSLVTLAACRRSHEMEAQAPNGKPADPTALPAAAAAAAVPSAEDKFGVPECDDFVQAYRGCLRQAAEDWRPYLQSNLDQMLSRFRQLAATEQSKPALAETCLMTRQMMK